VKTPIISSSKQIQSNTMVRKAMTTVFWDLKGVLRVNFQEGGDPVTTDRHCG
jgi:hypothetical protein